MAFWCNGAKRICDDCDNLCAGCKDFDGTGGQDIEIVTNADRIRAMSDEELADLFSAIADDGRSCTLICTNYDKCKRNNAIEVICRNHYLDWLKQNVKDGEDE